MGIPKLFGTLMRETPDAGRARRRDFDVLLFDLNGLVHSSYEKVLIDRDLNHRGLPIHGPEDIHPSEERISMEDIQHAVCKMVVEDVDKSIRKVNPRSIVIAIDGIAPGAKITQQRKRRFLSEDFFRSQISPGTEFMDLLNRYLSDKISPMRSNRKSSFNNFMKKKNWVTPFDKQWNVNEREVYPVIISTADQPKEGEEKIFILLNKSKSFVGPVCIHGLDADIIVRGFISPVKDITLWHEPKPGEMARSRYKSDDFFSIQSLREHFENICEKDSILSKKLVGQIFEKIKDKSISLDMFYKNLFFMVTIIFGNDFVPKMPAFAHTMSIPYILESLVYLAYDKKRIAEFIRDVFLAHRSPAYTRNNGRDYFSGAMSEIVSAIHSRPAEYALDTQRGAYKDFFLRNKGKVDLSTEFEYMKTVYGDFDVQQRRRGTDFLLPLKELVRESESIDDVSSGWYDIISGVNSRDIIQDTLRDLTENGWILSDDDPLSEKYIHEDIHNPARPPSDIYEDDAFELHQRDLITTASYFYRYMCAWTMLYYFYPGIVRTDLFYPYTQAPLARDTYPPDVGYDVNYNILLKKASADLDISNETSLVKIIPPRSDVFPENLQWIASPISPISDFFPEQYSTTDLLARVSHENSAYIPPVDMAAMNLFLYLSDV